MFAQIPKQKYFRTVNDTTWLYPMRYIESTLATTSVDYTFDGTLIICKTFADIQQLYTDIVNETNNAQPIGNAGFSLGVGTVLEDFGKDIYFKLSNGMTVIHWRLVKQLTPQLPQYVIPNPGNSPPETIGYATIWVSFGITNPAPGIFDLPLVTRTN